MGFDIRDGVLIGCTGAGLPAKAQLPAGVRRIGPGAFRGQAALAEISLPDSLTAVEDEAFRDCVGLRKIALPRNVERLGVRAFAGCTALTEIVFPRCSHEIGAEAFAGCTALRRLGLSPKLERLGERAFAGCGALRRVDLPPGAVRIGAGAFAGCGSLREMRLPGTLQGRVTGLFQDCAALAEVSLSEPRQEKRLRLAADCFAGCGSLRSLLTAWPADLESPELRALALDSWCTEKLQGRKIDAAREARHAELLAETKLPPETLAARPGLLEWLMRSGAFLPENFDACLAAAEDGRCRELLEGYQLTHARAISAAREKLQRQQAEREAAQQSRRQQLEEERRRLSERLFLACPGLRDEPLTFALWPLDASDPPDLRNRRSRLTSALRLIGGKAAAGMPAALYVARDAVDADEALAEGMAGCVKEVDALFSLLCK